MEQEISLITQRKMFEGTRFNSPRGIMRARLIKSFSENRGRRNLRKGEPSNFVDSRRK